MSECIKTGVYVKEVPSAVQPIAGVGTSTAGFIGMVPDTIKIPDHQSDNTIQPRTRTFRTNPPTNPPYRAHPISLCRTEGAGGR